MARKAAKVNEIEEEAPDPEIIELSLDEWCAEFDRAVRKMMQVDPPAGLRRRVMARIESPPPRRSFFVPAYGFAAAALAMVARALLGGSLCVSHMSRLATRSGPRLPSQGPRGLRSGHAPVSRGFHRQLASS